MCSLIIDKGNETNVKQSVNWKNQENRKWFSLFLKIFNKHGVKSETYGVKFFLKMKQT